MLEAIPHRLVQRVTRVDALEHDGQLKVAERHVAADPGNIPSGPARVPSGERIAEGGHLPVHRGADPRPRRYWHEPVVQPSGQVRALSGQALSGQRRGVPPIQPAGRDALGIPGGGLVTVMIYRIVERMERKILTPAL